jgi:hypothetical protein
MQLLAMLHNRIAKTALEVGQFLLEDEVNAVRPSDRCAISTLDYPGHRHRQAMFTTGLIGLSCRALLCRAQRH